MKVFGAAQSPFVRKVLVVLEEKGLSYELEPPAPALHHRALSRRDRRPRLLPGDVR